MKDPLDEVAEANAHDFLWGERIVKLLAIGAGLFAVAVVAVTMGILRT